MNRPAKTVSPSESPVARSRTAAAPLVPAWPTPPQYLDYLRDVTERAVLFADILRRRGDNMLEHERQGLPNVLHFDYETILDARRFERPANYALLRITGEHDVAGAHDVRAEDRARPGRRPVIVIDPRAGHGPGIGGFKRDSEVGMALREGHPCYFVIFFPEPCPGQTLADVLDAMKRFVREVAARHPDLGAPVLYGNCQAGWAVALLSAMCAPDVVPGPAVLNGAPLSYWAGDPAANPMRVMGSLSGGAWLSHLFADLGDGRLDGAWLAMNFENLQPERALWSKYTAVFDDPEGRSADFLDFERWWNGWYFLSREEIVATVENLFIGDRLEQGEMRVCPGCKVDLHAIRNPLVVFASSGDNITPPYEALGWIPVVYRSTEALKAAGERIVYLVNPHVGHLGIFVSAKVARLEHRAILEHVDELEALEPGLYQMHIDNPSGSRDSRKGEYRVRFEPRRVESLRRYAPHRDVFERVRGVSERNERFYGAWISPWVRAATTPASAELLRWTHPMRLSRYLWSDEFNPALRALAPFADAVRGQRAPLSADDPFREAERRWFAAVAEGLESARKFRDNWLEDVFGWVFGR